MLDSVNELYDGCIQVRLGQNKLSINMLIEIVVDNRYIPLRRWSMHSTPSERMDGSMHVINTNSTIVVNEKKKKTNVANAGDDDIENAKGFEICRADSV